MSIEYQAGFFASASSCLHRHRMVWFHQIRHLVLLRLSPVLFYKKNLNPSRLLSSRSHPCLRSLRHRFSLWCPSHSPRMPLPLSSTPALPCFEEHANPPVMGHEASDFYVPCSSDRIDLAGVPLIDRTNLAGVPLIMTGPLQFFNN